MGVCGAPWPSLVDSLSCLTSSGVGTECLKLLGPPPACLAFGAKHISLQV